MLSLPLKCERKWVCGKTLQPRRPGVGATVTVYQSAGKRARRAKMVQEEARFAACGRTGRLAVEHRPADSVSQPLVIQYKLANRLRQLLALPLTFLPTGAFTLAVWRSRAYRFDCVGRCAEFVGGDMSYRRGLSGSIRRIPRGTGQIPCRGLRMAGCRARLRHRDLAPYPSSRQLDCLARRASAGCTASNRGSTCSAQSAAHTASSRWSASCSVPPRRTVMNLGSRSLGRITWSSPFTGYDMKEMPVLGLVYVGRVVTFFDNESDVHVASFITFAN